ncbi:MAG: hypothetical protein WBZ29_14365 [Methanocella sp.]
MSDFQPSDYQSALDLFNQTVANLTSFVEAERADALNELQAFQASQAMDSSDMGAYNLTMYGMDSVHSIQSNVIETVGNSSNYFINDTAATMAVQTDHTSVGTSLFSPLFNDPASLLPTHSVGTMIVWVAFALILGKFLLMRR